jgi:hypothetical protein
MRVAAGVHEDYRRTHEVKPGSNRSFGLLFALVFLILAAYPAWRHGLRAVRWWSVAIALLFALAAVVAPGVLAPANRLWFRFALFLGKLTTPVVTGIVFYLVITPCGAVARMFGWDPMRRKYSPDLNSYWIPRDPPGPVPESMANQY